MKKLGLILVLISSSYTFAQEYAFQKIGSDNYTFEMKGKIMVQDSLITIASNNQTPSKYPVKKQYENDTVQKFVSSLKALNANFTLNTKQNKFIYEFKDLTTDKKTKMIYYISK